MDEYEFEVENDEIFGGLIYKNVLGLKATCISVFQKNEKSDEEIKAYLDSESTEVGSYGHIYIDMCDNLIKSFCDGIEECFAEDDKLEKEEEKLFSEHLQSSWGIGIAWMKQYRRKCFEIWNSWKWYIKRECISMKNPYTYAALQAIHGKAMLVYAEIICLLENGFPDGAYAHYRSLYELWAVAEFLHNDSDEVSKAFIESIDSKSNSESGHYKWAKKSNRFTDKEEVIISNIVSEAHKTFSNNFDKPISNTKLKKVYTFPNRIIHPSAEGVFRRTSYATVEGVGVTIGRADNGLATPAINSSFTMYNITRLFLSVDVNPVSAIGIRVLDNIIGKKIAPFFEEIHKEEQQYLIKAESK